MCLQVYRSISLAFSFMVAIILKPSFPIGNSHSFDSPSQEMPADRTLIITALTVCFLPCLHDLTKDNLEFQWPLWGNLSSPQTDLPKTSPFPSPLLLFPPFSPSIFPSGPLNPLICPHSRPQPPPVLCSPLRTVSSHSIPSAFYSS